MSVLVNSSVLAGSLECNKKKYHRVVFVGVKKSCQWDVGYMEDDGNGVYNSRQ